MDLNDSDQSSDIFMDYEGFIDDHIWVKENDDEESVLNSSLNDAESLLNESFQDKELLYNISNQNEESFLNESLNNGEESELGQQNLTDGSDYLQDFSSDESDKSISFESENRMKVKKLIKISQLTKNISMKTLILQLRNFGKLF